MSVSVGDILKMVHAGGHWFGLVIELLHDGEVVRVWRPACGFQTWPLKSHYQIEVVNEGR